VAEADVAIPVSVLDRRITEIRIELNRIEQIKAELRALERLLNAASSLATPRYLQGPRQAITNMLSTLSCSQAELVRMLLGRVESRSKDTRRVLNTTIGQLRKEGRIKVTQGRLQLVEA
jgi:hypothetical protein